MEADLWIGIILVFACCPAEWSTDRWYQMFCPCIEDRNLADLSLLTDSFSKILMVLDTWCLRIYSNFLLVVEIWCKLGKIHVFNPQYHFLFFYLFLGLPERAKSKTTKMRKRGNQVFRYFSVP